MTEDNDMYKSIASIVSPMIFHFKVTQFKKMLITRHFRLLDVTFNALYTNLFLFPQYPTGNLRCHKVQENCITQKVFHLVFFGFLFSEFCDYSRFVRPYLAQPELNCNQKHIMLTQKQNRVKHT